LPARAEEVDVSTLVTQRFGASTSERGRRAQDFARSRALDELGGRTVWCATALPDGREQARELRAALAWAAADGVAAAPLEVTPEPPLREAAQRLDERLTGAEGVAPGVAERDAERDTYELGAGSGETLVGGSVRPEDVVVLHDALTAILVEAIRERGAHPVWHVRIAGPDHEAAVDQAWSFLREFTAGVGAYIVSTSQDAAGGGADQEIAALVPALGAVKRVAAAPAAGELAWSSVLADVLHADRGEMVGGRLHPRPTVAMR
jgi:trehalose synthase